MNKALENKTAMITGCSRGIGKAIAERFAAEGANLIINARDETALHALADALRKAHGIDVHVYAYDVSDAEQVKATFRDLAKEKKCLDVLVNNAGQFKAALAGMMTTEMMKQMIEVNINGALYHMQYASRQMMKQQSGSIMNISSILGQRGHAGQSVYSASKAALIGATHSLAKELGSFNIRVNALAPGMIETDMIQGLSDHDRQSAQDAIVLKRLGTTEDVANAALFLASDQSSYITSQILAVDGGMIV